MLGESHSLLIEFPELKERIHELKVSDAQFASMYEEYENLDKEIIRIEEQIETPDDQYTEQLKMKRVQLKDDLLALLNG